MARSYTCCNIVFEEIRDSTLPGKRAEENRAGITPKILRGTRDHTIKTLC